MASFYTSILFVSCIIPLVYSGSTKSNITASNPLTYQQKLVSSNGVFELGFFSPDNSSDRFYLGLWYANKEADGVLQVIWIANRNNPMNDSFGVVLIVSDNGKLELLNGGRQSVWSSNSDAESEKSNNTIAMVTDDGSFVLYRDLVRKEILWQSFDHPTDTLLPKMKLEVIQGVQVQELVSWRSVGDPSNGSFRLGINPHNPPEMVIWDGDGKLHWRTGPWVGSRFIGMDLRPSQLLDTFNYVNESQGKISFQLTTESLVERYVMQSDGVVVRKDWDNANTKWKTAWKSLNSECDIYGKCGEFGICNSKHPKKLCDCMEGYEPKNETEWKNKNWSSGCKRKKQLWCESVNAQGKSDRFIKLKSVKVPDFAQLMPSNGEDDCRTRCLRICSCLAYTYSFNGPDSCMIWNRSLIDVQVFSYVGRDIFIRTSEPDNSSKLKIILPVVFITIAIFALSVVYCLWRWKRRRNRITRADTPAQDEVMEPSPVYPIEFKDLPLFTFDQLSSATNNFEESNKLGQGGFGPVYKGKLDDGQDIAVKRLSRVSGQGIEEFMNEVLLISKLQHRNLVRLLGCCVERGEKMLVYEYMPNKSLDALLFDPVNKESLDWQKRFNIIEGICRGLLYLHRDSRLKVIHRDLKASNVLLDEDLNPKISDFGMARIFAQKEDQANTLRVVGTLGYMAPEYAMEGRFSEKSDVFSFGVLLLEIISSRRVKSFENDGSLSLIGYAWKLWNEDDILSLVDQTISSPNIHCEVWKCIQVGLLCVQEFPEDRPTISDVISMLRCDISELPYPTQPGYVRRLISKEDSTGNSNFSVNLVSLTRINGR